MKIKQSQLKYSNPIKLESKFIREHGERTYNFLRMFDLMITISDGVFDGHLLTKLYYNL